jgi:hypothetical protein
MRRTVQKSGLLLIFLLTLAACGYNSRDAQTNTAAAKKFTTADVAKLRWLEGTWRGSGVDQPYFYERYRFESETTLAVDGFPDEKLEKVDDTTRFELKDGQFASSNYAASSIDDRSADFVPIAKAKNSFRWERVSDNLWKATLRWPGGNSTAQERVYHMERFSKGSADSKARSVDIP